MFQKHNNRMGFIGSKCFRISILHHEHKKCVLLVISQKFGTRVANIYRPEDVVLGRSCVRMTMEKTEAIKPTIFWRRSEPAKVDRFFIASITGVPYRQFRYSCARWSDVTVVRNRMPGGFRHTDVSVSRYYTDYLPP